MNRIIFSLFILTSCTIKNEFSINDWAYYRGDNSVSHYKPFDLINKDNVHKLTKVLEDKLPAAGYATPSTYIIDDKQYIVIACGGGKLNTKSGSSYVAYSIN